ncbi:MAG: hypothetical protein ACO1OX_07795 [Novosphingobium sp.]
MPKQIENLAPADAAAFRTAISPHVLAVLDPQLSALDSRLDALESAMAALGGYIINIPMIGTASAGEELTLHAVGRAFTIPANFGSGSLEVIKGANPTATVDVIIEKTTDSGETWSTVGTISVSTSGVVTATTAGGAAINFSKGDGLRPKAPATADATFANWGFTIIGVS